MKAMWITHASATLFQVESARGEGCRLTNLEAVSNLIATQQHLDGSLLVELLLQERVQHVDGYGENHGGVFLHTNLCQCLQITQLDRYRLLRDNRSGLGQLFRRFVLAFGVN